MSPNIKLTIFQEVSVDPDINGAHEGLERTNNDIQPTFGAVNSPIMEEVD